MMSDINIDDILPVLQENALFEGFSPAQLQRVAHLIHQMTVQSGDVIIQEGEVSDNIYLIKQGTVAVTKIDSETQQVHKIAELTAKDVIGEISLLDNAPRSASVRALDAVTLYVLSIRDLRQYSEGKASYATMASHIEQIAEEAKALIIDQPFFPIIIQNLAKGLGQRIRSTNDAVVAALRKELEQTKARVAMGFFLITVLGLLSCYVFVLKIVEVSDKKFATTTMISVPLIAVFASISFLTMLKMRYPLYVFGLTLKNARVALRESLIFSAVIMLGVLCYKWYLIHYVPAQATKSLFYFKQIGVAHGFLFEIFWMFVYLLFAPLQEFIVRGTLQSSLQEFLIGPYRVLWAIVISNLLFSVTHLHISLALSNVVFVLGLCWGWLYARHKTLIGVVVSHILLGFWTFWVVGLFR